MAYMEVLLLAAAAFYFIYKWATRSYNTFDQRGMYYEKPWPVVGNFGAVIMGKNSMMKYMLDYYQRTKSHKIVGLYNFRDPVYIIKDPASIKKITVKDFEYFPNHMPFIKVQNDQLFGSMLSIMKDQRWKDMRSTLSPLFTASKMRAMFPLMNECFEESLKHLRAQVNTQGEGFDIEMKQCFTRLSNDIIASTAFGLKVNSYVDKKNNFYEIGQIITKFRGALFFKFFLLNVLPDLMNLLGYKFFNKESSDYFTRLIIDTMKYREENNIVRPDMIQLLMEAKKESAQNWTDDEIVAQCLIFFFAAFDNNANLICTTCHELMDNPDVQQRLYEEALEMRDELQGAPLSYDDIGKMKYLDMVVSESLRKWSLAPFTDRICSKDYKLTDDDDNLIFEFKAGDRVWIPIGALQWDEEYFADPQTFDPERFSDANKDNIKPFTYLPFGAGPRVCIGNRYALMQGKAMLYHLVLNFKLERSAKTVSNLLENFTAFQVMPKNGYWLRLVARK